VIAHQCSSADIRLIMVGIFGGLLSAGIYAGGTSALGRRASTSGLLAWAALFGALGWNFINQGLHPRGGPGSTWLLTGAMFGLMALGGLVALLMSLISDIREAGRPNPVAGNTRLLVRAAIPAALSVMQPAGTLGWQPSGGAAPGVVADPPGRGAVLLRLGTWLLASLAGAGAGIALGAALISMLR
jgi:hypothetical protein